MESISKLADEIYRERVLRARATPPEQKLLDGFRLFEFACRIMLDGVRNENPGADESQIQEIFVRRFEIVRKLEQFR
jgi:hypothetical protein